MVFLIGILTIKLIEWSASDSFYYWPCSGRSAWFCELAKSARPFEFFGLNPILFAMAAFLGVFLCYCARRFWTGWSAKLEDDLVTVPGFLGSKSILTCDVQMIEVKPKLFSSIATLNIYSIDGRKLSVANARPADAERFAVVLRER